MINKTQHPEIAPLCLTLMVSLVAVLGLLHSVTTQPAQASDGIGTVIDPPHQLKDFTLTEQTGKAMNFSDLRGQVALVFFGYTHCPDVCPIAVAKYTQVKAALGSAANKAAFVFISVDGQRDTPEVLTHFLSAFDPNFIGLTGDASAVLDIGKDFWTTFIRDPKTNLVEHSSRMFLVDPQNRLRITYLLDVPPQTIASDMLKLGSSQ